MRLFLKHSGIKVKFSQEQSASLWSPIFMSEHWPSFTNPVLKKKKGRTKGSPVNSHDFLQEQYSGF